MTARDFPCVAQIEPTDSGIQSICAFMILGRSGLPQTWPSDHAESSRRSWTFGWRTGASSGSGKPEGSDEAHLSPEMLPSTPSALRRRKATALAFQPTSVPAINSKALVVSRSQSSLCWTIPGSILKTAILDQFPHLKQIGRIRKRSRQSIVPRIPAAEIEDKLVRTSDLDPRHRD